ncbi:MAG: tail-specific protease [Desulfobacteraceae bacterium]|nr:MAG: tail-specific protease [Desulfobacteraceae bacterium]
MTLFQPKKIFLTLAALVFSVFLINGISLNGCALEKTAGSSTCPSIPSDPGTNFFSPEKDHEKINSEVLHYLQNYHYKKQKIDDGLSDKVFTRYLSDLDWNRIYFLQSDIDDFQVLKYCLDDAIKQDDLKPAFMMYNRYQIRVIERLQYSIDLLENRMDRFNFQLDEQMKIDRKDSPWPRDKAELDDLWRKRIKNEVINLKLSGKEPDKIKELLEKRYKSQLSRINQRNNEDVFRTFMNSLAQIFDPHTQYFSPSISENFDIQMKLSLEGIGALLQSSNEHTKIVRLIPAGPAEKSGLLKPGDRIVGVGQGNDKEIVDVVGWRLDEVVDLIRGPKKTVVQLEIIPADTVDENSTKIVKITRDTVKLEEQAAQKKILTFASRGVSYKIGVIDIPTFYIDFNAYMEGREDYKSTTRDVRRLLEELVQEKVDGLIVDLRDNGGGALEEAKALTGLFIQEGPIVQVRKENGYTATLKDPDKSMVYGGPLVVMINRMSASASEIFAGAVQDYNRGIVIGTQSFGKGTVQSLENLLKGQLKITRGKFYRISGESTQNKGVIPDILFPEIYEKDKIGESALPEALPWDTIGKVRYQPLPEISAKIDQVRAIHDKRKKDDPGFLYLAKGIERIEEVRRMEYISLNENTRKKERGESEKKRLELENMRRAITGEKLLSDVTELENNEDDELSQVEKEDEKDKFDPMMTEAENILVDYIHVSSDRIAQRK